MAADVAAIDGFLAAHIETSMFPLSNLRSFGLDGEASFAPRVWLREVAGEITDVLSMTREGMVMPQCPTGPWADVAQALRGRSVVGVIGPGRQARAVIAACGVEGAATTLDEDEPFLRLDMADLVVPEGVGRIVPIGDADGAVIVEWMMTYQREALHTPEAEVRRHAEGSLKRYVAKGSHVVLMEGDVPLAMTGFNAQLPGIVQIGGVFTPVPLRGRGYARRALALHLAQVTAERAVLFSANEAARRAYEAIGFRRDGDWTLCLFEAPVVAV